MMVRWYTGRLVLHQCTSIPIYQLPTYYRTKESNVEEIRGRLTALHTKLKAMRRHL
jgi:hypothetical protein